MTQTRLKHKRWKRNNRAINRDYERKKKNNEKKNNENNKKKI